MYISEHKHNSMNVSSDVRTCKTHARTHTPYLHVHLHMQMHLYTYIYICMYVHIHRRRSIRTCKCIHAPTCTYTHAYMHVHMAYDTGLSSTALVQRLRISSPDGPRTRTPNPKAPSRAHSLTGEPFCYTLFVRLCLLFFLLCYRAKSL